jgi:hypothetical protein
MATSRHRLEIRVNFWQMRSHHDLSEIKVSDAAPSAIMELRNHMADGMLARH